MEKVGEPFELLFVDDGSRDRTPELLRQARRRDERVQSRALHAQLRAGGGRRGRST
jgi:glycosyltransferase involved in cell wall biosynthesis